MKKAIIAGVSLAAQFLSTKTKIIIIAVIIAIISLITTICALIGAVLHSPLAVFFDVSYTTTFAVTEEDTTWGIDFSQGMSGITEWTSEFSDVIKGFFTSDSFRVFEDMEFVIYPSDYEGSYGYEMILDVLVDMDAAYTSNLKLLYPDVTGYYGTSTNLVDVLKIYAVLVGTEGRNPCELTKENMATLAMVYERMVVYNVTDQSYSIKQFDDLGSFYITSEESEHYGKLDYILVDNGSDYNQDGVVDTIYDFGEVVVDESLSESLPLGTRILIEAEQENLTIYQVVAYDTLLGGVKIQVCLEPDNYESTTSGVTTKEIASGYYNITFLYVTSNEDWPECMEDAYYADTIEVTNPQGTLTLLSGTDYIEQYELSQEQVSFYEDFDTYGASILGNGFYMTYTGMWQTGNGESMVEIALTQLGNQNGEQYWSWYGFNSRVAWCATFVSWCGEQNGYIELGIIPKFSSCDAGGTWFKEAGLWREQSSGYIPSAGDIIFFGTASDYTHVGIVQYVEGDNVITVEGNSSNQVAERSYLLSSTYIQGYGTPNYPSCSGELSGDSIEEMVWNYLRTCGFSEESTAGIMGNLQQESSMDPTKVQSSGHAAGICQWESYKYSSDRWLNLYEYAKSEGVEWTDLKIQLDFMIWELNGGDTTTSYILNRDYGGLGALMSATEVAWAVEAFEYSFERAGTPNMAQRYAYANYYFNKFSTK